MFSSPSRELRKAVFSNDIDAAANALKNGANPNRTESYENNFTITSATSPEMASLLLKNGAKSNIPLLHYLYEKKEFDLDKRFDLIAIAVNCEPCLLHNEEINHALLVIMRSSEKEALDQNFNWESSKGKCIVSLMRASSDLCEVVRSCGADPVSWASRQQSDVLIRLMFQNNFILYETLEHDKTSKYHKKLEKYSHCYNETPKILFDKIWLSFLFCEIECNSPIDIFSHIAMFITITDPRLNLFRNYRQENIARDKEKSDYTKDDNLSTKSHFYEKYKYFSPSSFFRKINEEKAKQEYALISKNRGRY